MKKMSHKITPQIKEATVLRQIRYLLDLLQNKNLLQYWRINTGPSLRRRGVFAPNKDSVGFPDLLVLIVNGPTIFAEVKRPGGKQTKLQKEFERRVNVAKGERYYMVWDSVDVAKKDLSLLLGL